MDVFVVLELLHPERESEGNDFEHILLVSLTIEPHVSEVVVFVSEFISVGEPVTALLSKITSLTICKLVEVKARANGSPEELDLARRITRVFVIPRWGFLPP